MPLFLITLPREGNSKDIYNIQFVTEIKVTVEPLKLSPVVGQCQRCLLFGHSAKSCFAAFRCKNCAANHPSTSCPTPDQKPFKCCNCGGSHRATYRGCDRAPQYRPSPQGNTGKATNTNNTAPKAARTVNTSEKITPKTSETKQNTNQPSQDNKSQKASMAQMVKKGSTQESAGPNPQDIVATLQQLTQVKEAISSLAGIFNSMAHSLKNLN